ncbi:MAG: hypothetical protein RI967_983 [Planctomycetota bacterium]|jgi:hypothetical protein
MTHSARILPLLTLAFPLVAHAGDASAPAYEELVCWGGSAAGAAVCDVPAIALQKEVARLSLGFGHGILRYTDGTIACWGDDEFGQCQPPTPPDGVVFSQISAGSQHNVARLSDGSIVAWGRNNSGQTDVPAIGALTATLIAAGEAHGLAALSNGSVIQWGFNPSAADVPLSVTAPTALAGGFDHSAALLSDGTIVCWGDNTEAECDVPALGGGETYTSVACGRNFTIALKNTGEVVAWGDATYTAIPPTPDGETIVEAGGKFLNGYFRTSEGSVVVWGDGTEGQLDEVDFGTLLLKRVAVGYTFLVANGDVDCDGDLVADRTQIVADPTLDCDDNGEIDSCTINEDRTFDWNENSILDTCEIAGDTALDCDGDGRYDEGQIERDPDLDCDLDTILDSCEIAEDSTLDCDGDGILDACGPTSTGVASSTVSPVNESSVIRATGTGLAPAILDVRVQVTVKADLGSYGEWLVIKLNDTIVDYMFVGSGRNCPVNPQVETFLLDKDLFNGLAPDGDVTFDVEPTALVSSFECTGSSCRIDVTWLAAGADCNMNGTPDICEVQSGDVPDANEDGIPDTCQFVPTRDLDGDGRDDIVWWNNQSKTQSYWLMDGATRLSSGVFPDALPDNSDLVAFADLDGDGRGDLIYLNRSTRELFGRLMEGIDLVEEGTIGSGALPAGWSVIATPDLNGDGKADILIRNGANGALNGWIMDGLVRTGGGAIQSSADLRFQGAGDLDGDGDDDLVWRTEDGEVRGWLMAGLAVSEDAALTDAANLPVDNWTCRGLGDLDGDGKDDIVWRRTSDGATFGWFMDGLTRTGGGSINSTLGTDFRVDAILDCDGDMKADLVWRRLSDGGVFVWLMDGLEKREGGLVQSRSMNFTIIDR